MPKKLAVTIELSDDDFQVAYLQLKRSKLLPDGVNEDYFTEGDHTIINMSEIDSSQSVQMGIAMMLFKIGVLEDK